MERCPDEAELQRFISKQLAPDRAQLIADHFGNCDECRQLAFALASVDTRPATPSALAAGDKLARFEIRRCLGKGGMGIVYAAHDEALKRDVAIKVLHVRDADDRLLREAQALAQLDHPNVVRVYDVGSFEDQIFIAMELVDGLSLDRSALGTWREIVAAFEQAGRGLAAAHARGLVHRDFKPSNVMIDRAGRVKILDFGLVQTATDASVEGALVGTPAYMAPEQLAREPADARSDQYSFCLTLYEVLAGKRISRERPPLAVPGWLRAVLERGLAEEPAARFASMDELLVALARYRRRPRWTYAAAIGAVALTGAVAFARGHTDPCATVGVQPASYDAAAIRRGFAPLPGGPATAERVIAQLEHWRTAAGEVRASACKAARIDRVESPELFDLRMECVADSARQIAALANELARPSPALAASAVTAVERVDVTACRSARKSLDPMRSPVDVAGHARFTALRTQLAGASALGDAGHMVDAAQQATAIARAATQERFPAIAADAWGLAGRMRFQSQQPLLAREAFQASIVAAEAAGYDRRRAATYLELITIETTLDRPEDAARLLSQARAVIARLDDKAFTWRLLWSEGGQACYAMKFATCVAKYREALAAHGSDHDQIAVNLYYGIAGALLGAGNAGEALATIDRAIAIQEHLSGKESAALVDLLTLRADVLDATGNPRDALATRERVFAIAGEGMPQLTVKLADSRCAMGQPRQALELLDHTLATAKEAFGDDSTTYSWVLEVRAKCLLAAGRSDEALAVIGKSLAVVRDKLGKDDFALAAPLLVLGDIERKRGNLATAIRAYGDNVRLSDATPGSSAIPGRLALGEVLLEAKRPLDALEALEPASKQLAAQADPTLRADVRLALLRAVLAVVTPH